MSAIHHVAITVTDLERSLAFYENLGFKTLTTKDTPEKQKRSAFMTKDGLGLEIFWYADHIDNPASRVTIGNNVAEVGSKHFALRTDSIENTRKELGSRGIKLASQPEVGDVGYQFFFIRDPDGIWIEYVQDDMH